MDKQKLKEKLHEYIDRLDDENELQMLHEAAVEYETAGEKDIVDELTPEQLKRLEESLKQVEEGKTVSYEEAMKRIALWRSAPPQNLYG